MPLRPGDPAGLGAYELVGRLGEGGMGTVYLGCGPDGRLVAIKMVRSEFAHEPEFRGRFRSEVNRAKQVPPFSTAEVLDADPDHEPPYLVVEYVDGPSLAAEVREKGPLSDAALHGVAVGIATALGAIHGAGVIHRDLKPGNVLFARGGIKVIDFGIARAFEATSQHTRTDQMVGTVAYMAPERFDPVGGRPVTAAADIFAWGAVVAYAATGKTPFAAESAPATAMRILTQEPDLSGLPGALAGAVGWALAKDPADRPTARELLDLLLAGDAPGPMIAASQRTGATQRSGRPRRGRTVVVAATAIAVLAAAGVGTAVRYLPHDDGQATGPVPSGSSARPTVQQSLSAEQKTQAIFRGARRTLIHLAEIDRDMAMESDYEELTVGDGTGAKSEFALIPAGVEFMIQYLSDPDSPRSCLGVKLSLTAASTIVPAECYPAEGTLFRTAPTGEKDDQGRPTYWISSETHGVLEWSAERKEFFIEVLGDFEPATTFSFVDRGPLPSPSPGG